MPGFDISPETMRQAADALDVSRDEVRALHDKFTAAIQSYADAFGGDDIGSLLGVAHEALSDAVTECFTSNVEELEYYSTSLREMADSHQTNDDEIAALFGDLMGEVDGTTPEAVNAPRATAE